MEVCLCLDVVVGLVCVGVEGFRAWLVSEVSWMGIPLDLAFSNIFAFNGIGIAVQSLLMILL